MNLAIGIVGGLVLCVLAIIVGLGLCVGACVGLCVADNVSLNGYAIIGLSV